WNTRLEGDRWVPTFPTARYVIPGEEWQFWKWEAEQGREPSGCIADSVMPIVEAGCASLVDDKHEIPPGLRVEATHGHTPPHGSPPRGGGVAPPRCMTTARPRPAPGSRPPRATRRATSPCGPRRPPV